MINISMVYGLYCWNVKLGVVDNKAIFDKVNSEFL